jgi:putative hydrolase of the HAD superfamily
LAVVTNNDGTAEQQLLDFGVAQIGPGPFADVVVIVDSTVVGFSKPDPRIFGPALAALGTDPARTLYVGDTVHADVLGATRAGMPVVQLDPLGLHVDWDHERAADLDEVLARLGH